MTIDTKPPVSGPLRHYYWTNNIAKTRICDQILRLLEERGELVVYDFGAGRGGAWPDILRRFPTLRLVCYEPSDDSRAHLKQALAGLNAEVHGGDADAVSVSVSADVVVSFSVLEHVMDREGYLRRAARALKPDGVFYLNYDDGHFRPRLDFDLPGTWAANIKEAVRNAGASLWPRIGKIRLYQKRVNRDDIDALVRRCGFQIADSRYENISCLKDLSKSIPEAEKAGFAAWWLQAETELNERYNPQGTTHRGDTSALWRVAVSRTLALRRA